MVFTQNGFSFSFFLFLTENFYCKEKKRITKRDKILQQLREKDAQGKDLTSFVRVILNVAQSIKSIIVRLWTVMMKMTCQKWIWVDK